MAPEPIAGMFFSFRWEEEKEAEFPEFQMSFPVLQKLTPPSLDSHLTVLESLQKEGLLEPASRMPRLLSALLPVCLVEEWGSPRWSDPLRAQAGLLGSLAK